MTDRNVVADRDFGMGVAFNGLRSRGYAPEVVFDIGAADGQWAQQVLELWPDTKVVCFEPLPQRRQALERLQGRYPGRVQLMNCGVGDEDTTLSIGITDSLFDSSFAYGGKSSLAVPVHRLDTLHAQGKIPAASFIKVDVQGFERRVLEGGESLFRRADFALLECQFFPFCKEMRFLDETIAHCSRLGLVPYEFVDLLRRPLDGAMGQCDILFIQKGHALVSDHRWA